MTDTPTNEATGLRIDEFLEAIAPIVPDSTYYSYKSTLQNFRDWCRSSVECSIDTSSVAEYAMEQTDENSIQTVSGQVDTLSNFLAYLENDNPGLIKHRIGMKIPGSISREDSSVSQNLKEEILMPFPDSRSVSIEVFFEHLNEAWWGTREYVFAHLIFETQAQPFQIQNLSKADVDTIHNTVEIEIPPFWLVSEEGLIESRKALLSDRLIDAIKFYLKHERADPPLCNYLLTTHQGQVEESTLRRSVKSISDDAHRHLIHNYDSAESLKKVTPKDLWRFSAYLSPFND